MKNLSAISYLLLLACFAPLASAQSDDCDYWRVDGGTITVTADDPGYEIESFDITIHNDHHELEACSNYDGSSGLGPAFPGRCRRQWLTGNALNLRCNSDLGGCLFEWASKCGSTQLRASAIFVAAVNNVYPRCYGTSSGMRCEGENGVMKWVQCRSGQREWGECPGFGYLCRTYFQ